MITEPARPTGHAYITSHRLARLRTRSSWCEAGAKGAKWVAVLLVGLMLGGCHGGQPQATTVRGSGIITVAAAASLAEAFTQIGRDFQAEHAGTTVSFTFGSSATLATQITQGAPVDVFAAASPATMKTVTDAGAAGTPTNFVSNTLEIAVPKGNPHRVTGLKDFADQDRRIALCDPSVPCGAAAVKVLAAAKITAAPDTLEQDVKATLQKVSRDEVDAALVYRTDVISSADEVDGIDFLEATHAVNRYPIAALKASKNAALAKAFVDYVLSPAGQDVLSRAGFAKP
jgi:molybdate transport system substrate-binding protein